MIYRCRAILSGLTTLVGLLCLVSAPEVVRAEEITDQPTASPVSFSRDVRQLLSDRCYLCHGPDENSRQADLRLDNFAAATEWAIVPGDPEASEVLTRITSDDPDLRMPPPESNKPPLTAEQVQLLKRWIAEGAEYERHWAFDSPERPETPQVNRPDWNKHPIDRFVLAKLQERGWEPSPQADRRTLLRRASFDLTGLPPTPEQIQEFLDDESPDAWSHALDRLLASTSYGEHQARHWLDAARYADTNGYQYDFQRDQWVWRDWVIAAFNENKPFDEFTIEQLAGDLLPGATAQQRLATGFNRNHPITIEGGIIDEEYRVEYVLDRTTTVGTVWMGMTLGCARCHDHKYDPLTQKEFYQLSAFFNQVPERGMRGFNPSEKITSPLQETKFREARRQLVEAEDAVLAAYAAWKNPPQEKLFDDLRSEKDSPWPVRRPETVESLKGSTLDILEDQSVAASGDNPAQDVYEVVLPVEEEPVRAIRLIAMPSESGEKKWLGRSSNGNFVLSEIEVEATRPKDQEKYEPVEITKASATYSQFRFNVADAIDGSLDDKGWAIRGEPGSAEKEQTATFTLAQPVIAGENIKLKVRLRFESSFGQHQMGRFRLATNRSYGNVLAPIVLAASEKEPSERTRDEQLAIAQLLSESGGTQALQEALSRLAEARKANQRLLEETPETMVMRDIEKPRGAYVLDRGEYDKRGERVEPDTPSWLPSLGEDLPRNRLGLAKWLTKPGHPLTARVAVNRFWLELFGLGLLDSPEDFGLQSQPPSHPELLDWLAVEFVESGWDVKQLLKTIMTSQTYQQASTITAEMAERDAENRFLSHGPRLRLDAETIRDAALAVSGLLHREIGGPSVFPYHPQGLWMEINNRPGYSRAYRRDSGDKLYRRSIYTFWKRTVTPPSMAVFDAPSREYCLVRRSRTNTPLQAFVMLHDPQFVEAARCLAARMLKEGGQSFEEQIDFGFTLALGRPPTEQERRVLASTYQQKHEQYQSAPAQAERLLSIGESPNDDQLPLAEHAAMTTVARLLINLSEFITKG
ncbi:MAG: PSD1 and planctomycete cytochrome C domain-containing protein [Lacipirellulaceae bacterium]